MVTYYFMAILTWGELILLWFPPRSYLTFLKSGFCLFVCLLVSLLQLIISHYLPPPFLPWYQDWDSSENGRVGSDYNRSQFKCKGSPTYTKKKGDLGLKLSINLTLFSCWYANTACWESYIRLILNNRNMIWPCDSLASHLFFWGGGGCWGSLLTSISNL
jgi:hypothetical protein